MHNDISTEERIDNYLLDRMSAQERRKFESELASDPELQKELECQRQVANAVQRAAMSKFLKQHAELRNKKVISLFSSTKRVIWTITSIAAVFVLAIGFMNYNNTANVFRNEGLLAYNNMEIPVARDGNQIDILAAKTYHMIGDGEYSLARKTIEEARDFIKAQFLEEPQTDVDKYRNQILKMKKYDLDWYEAIIMLQQGKVYKARKALNTIISSNSPYSISAMKIIDSTRSIFDKKKRINDNIDNFGGDTIYIPNQIATDSLEFKDKLSQAESLRIQFGEFDTRYLDTLSQVVRIAKSNNFMDEAIKYRILHIDIIERKYSNKSIEYAEDIWRLGNLYGIFNDSLKYKYHKQAESIYSLYANSPNEYPYCDAKYTIFNYYVQKKQLEEAIKYLEEYASLYPRWINENWHGLLLDEIGYAHAYNVLGSLYVEVGDSVSAISNYIKSSSIIENGSLFNVYEYSYLPYESLSVLFNSLNQYEEAAKWRSRYVEILGQQKGYESEDYITQLSRLRYNYYSLNKLDSIKIISHRLLDKIEHRDKHIGISIYEDTLYLNTYKDLVSFCSIFNDNNGVIEYSKAVLDYLYKAKLQYSLEYYYHIDQLLLVYHIMHRYQEEYSLYEEYEETAKRLRLTKTESYCSYLRNKIETLIGLSKINESYNTINQLVKLTKRLHGNKSLEIAISYQAIASNYNYLEKYADAQAAINKCKRILNAGKIQFISKEDSLAFTTSLNVEESRSVMNSDIRRAEQLLLSVADEVNNIPGCEYIIHGALGFFYGNRKRDFNKAASYFNKAKKDLESSGDTTSTEYMTMLNNLGMCYFSLGYSDDALNMFDIVINNILTNYDKQHALYGVAEQNKAIYYANITNYSEAIECSKEALTCLKTVFGESSEKYATCLLNLGECYLELDDFNNASSLLNEAVNILENIGSPYLMAAYSDIIAIHYLNRELNDVTELFNKVYIGIKSFQLENTDIEAYLYGKIGYAMLRKRMPEAQKFLKKYLDIQEICGSKSTLQYLYGLSCYALSSFYNNTQSENIIPILASQYREVYMNNVAFLSENDRESMITGPYYSQIKDILFSSRNVGNNDIDLYDFILFYKSLLLSTSISYSNSIYNSGDKTLIENYNRLLQLQSNLNEYSIFEDAVTYEKVKRESSKIERSLAEFLKQNGAFEDYIRYTFQDVKNSLKSDEIAIEFVNYNDLKDGNKYYGAMLVSNERDVPCFINIGTSEEFEKLMTISPIILYGKSDISRQTYNNVWSKILPYLKNVKTVYFSPSGVFNKIAIEHLNNGKDCFNYLYNTIRVSSSREICKVKSQSLHNKAILYGGLYYDEDDTIMVKESNSIHSTKTVAPELFRGSRNASSTKRVWTYLPGTLVEVQKISSILKKSNVGYISYTATKGNEESFKALSGKNVDILHIATHGYYITESQSSEDSFIISNPFIVAQNKPYKVLPLLRSGLILSGGNKAWNGDIIPEGIEDGILTSYEISTLDMHNCDIVVLSACETALGDISDDGVIGLQRAFKKTGVKSIIMSLWEVDDNVTTLMMQSFYDNLIKGMNKRNAFNAAQAYIRGKFPDPRYWATFIMLD